MTNLKTKVITNNRPILLGKSGENEATLIKFPINVFFPFVNATSFSLVHQRHGDVAPYPCVISQGEGFINWSINSADVANQGNGVAQLTAYNEEGLVAKTVVFTTVVTDSLGYVAPPAPQTAWVDQVAGYARTAEQAATQASEAAVTAQSVFTKGEGDNSVVSVNPEDPNTATDHDSTAIGAGNQVLSSGGIAIGTNNRVTGQNAIAIGSKIRTADPNTASGTCSTAIGVSCEASGTYAIAMGNQSEASGQAAVAMGWHSEATLSAAFAAGYFAKATHQMTGAIGWEPTASGSAAMAFGDHVTASGAGSLAANRQTEAEASASTALGYGTDATGACSLVVGAFNAVDTEAADATTGRRKYVMIVGNGTDNDHRSNAMTFDWDGNMELAGSIKIGNTVLTEARLQALLALLN